MSGRAWLFRALPTLLLLGVFGIGEAMVRLSLPPVDSLRAFVRSAIQRHDFEDRAGTSIFRGDPDLLWALRPGLRDVLWDFTHVSTNAQGLRAARDLAPKRRGGLRVVCLGDSVTFGFRVPLAWAGGGVGPGQPFPALLEDALRARLHDATLEVVSAAVPGYSSQQGRLWLERDFERWRPDVVIALFGWNDLDRRRQPDSVTLDDRLLPRLARHAVARSQLLLRLVLFARPGLPSPTEEVQVPLVARVPPAQFAANFAAMARRARRGGAHFLALSPVLQDVAASGPGGSLATHRAALSTVLRWEGVPYLDIPELGESAAPGNAALFGERVHPNAAGHRLIASRLLEFLEASGWLQRP